MSPVLFALLMVLPCNVPATYVDEVDDAIASLEKAIKEKAKPDIKHFVSLLGDKYAGAKPEQKKTILAGVKLADKPVQSTEAKVAHSLPWNITVHDLGPSANDPMLANLKYVRTQDRVLLIDPPNRIVVGEIKG